MNDEQYTTKLGSGQGIIEETIVLLELWSPGMTGTELFKVALESGKFPNISARRLKNLILEGFAPRYLIQDDKPAIYIKSLQNNSSNKELSQILYLYTCRRNRIFYDFVNEIYWKAYSSGQESISIDQARNFVINANQDGKTSKPWGASMIQRVPVYLVGTCADFGLVEKKKSAVRKILPFRIEISTVLYLVYDLHFSGFSDIGILNHTDWELFGLNRYDVLDELKLLSLKNWFIVQSAGDIIKISWQYRNMEDLIDAIIRR